jgi:hypothetical protein
MAASCNQIWDEYKPLRDNQLEAEVDRLAPSVKPMKRRFALSVAWVFGSYLLVAATSAGFRFFGQNETAQAIDNFSFHSVYMLGIAAVPLLAVVAHNLTGERAGRELRYDIANKVLEERRGAREMIRKYPVLASEIKRQV